ncbi:MAG TPA: hypothetical protein VK489_00530, partial [Ferruginibacter sp.]|nr:hypothetical protein [Ferruginibacter sp.]
VKKIKELNKQGIRPEDLEPVEVVTSKPKEIEPVYADVVGQISLKSLEKTSRKRRDNERNQNRPSAGPGGQRGPNQNRGGQGQQQKGGNQPARGGERPQQSGGNQPNRQQGSGGNRNNPNRQSGGPGGQRPNQNRSQNPGGDGQNQQRPNQNPNNKSGDKK